MYNTENNKNLLSDINLQKKLFISLGLIIIILIATLIIGLSTYEQPINDVIHEFVVATENLNESRLLNITTGIIRENLAEQRESIEEIKQKVHYEGHLQDYSINFAEKRDKMAKVEVTAEISEKTSKYGELTYEHVFYLYLIKINNDWKIAEMEIISTNLVG